MFIIQFGWKWIWLSWCSYQRFKELLKEIEFEYAVELSVEIQPTHTFDLNAQDALYHAEAKRQIRLQGFPKNNEDLVQKCKAAFRKISLDSIQRGFMRAYSRDADGNVDESIIPESISGWYDADISEDEGASDDLNIDSDECHTEDES